MCSRAGAILTSGASWGDLILTSHMLRDTRQARALGYCEIVSLTRDGLDQLKHRYPRSEQLIREAALKLATQRAMIVIAMYAHPPLHPRLLQLWPLHQRIET